MFRQNIFKKFLSITIVWVLLLVIFFWIDNHKLGTYQHQQQGISAPPVICPYSILVEDSIGSGGTVNITYSLTYKGPVVEGWPPEKDRYMPHYIFPGKNTFSIQPPPSYFKDCHLLVVVTSRRDNLQERQNIRETWKLQAILNHACVIFIIGSRTGEMDTAIDEKISKEANKHQDILQAEMVDHYNNLTLKSVMMLKFFVNESNFHDYKPPYYLMKTDDDSYVNLHQLLQLLHVENLKNLSFILGHRRDTPKTLAPIQNKKSKWFVPEYFFNGTSYPVFMAGPGYVMTRPAAKCLYEKSLNLPYFFLEDVFMGFAAENCRIPRYHCDAFHRTRPKDYKTVKGTDIVWTDFHENGMMEKMHHIFEKQMNSTCNTLAK